jgi:prevent-host-death family protein
MANTTINAKRLRQSLPEVVKRVRKGTRFTVVYRSRPAFQIVPVGDDQPDLGPLSEDPLYPAKALGRSKRRSTMNDHDKIIYRL